MAGYVTVLRLDFKLGHFAVIKAHQSQRDDEYQGQQGIEVIGNCLDEQLKARVRFALNATGNGSGPRGDGSNHANGRGGRVNDVGKLGAGDLVGIGDGTHDRAYGQTVEIVIHKNQDTQQEGSDQRTCLGLDVGLCPTAEGLRATGAVDQSDDNAQHDQKYKNAGTVGNGGDQTVIDDGVYRTAEVVPCMQKCADQNAHEQRGINLLGDQCQGNGDDRSKQRPCRLRCAVFAGGEEGNDDNGKCRRENGDGDDLACLFHKNLQNVLQATKCQTKSLRQSNTPKAPEESSVIR